MASAPLILAAGCALDTPPLELVRAAAAAGFDGVGLRLSHDHACSADGLIAIGDEIRAHGLVLHDVEVHRITMHAGDPGPLIDAAAAAGARHLLVVSDIADDEMTVAELRRCAQRCAAAGITAALEYMAWTNPASSTRAVAMAEAADMCIVVDLLHHHRLGEGVEELRALVAGGRLGWVQLCDAPAAAPGNGIEGLIDEARHRRMPPGHGGLPLRELLAEVPAHVPISVEVQSDELLSLAVIERSALLHRAASTVLGRAHDPSSTG